MAAVALGFSSCKQEDEPQYHAPTTFTISTPALQNVEFATSTEQTDPETFNLFCTQPDYGYSAICKYTALASLDPDCPEETAIELPNANESSAAMAIKTFELGAAICKYAGVTDEDQYAASVLAQGPVPVYFRAVCEIPGIEGSRIVSSNVVSYNLVLVNFAVKKPGWIYIVGDVQNPVTGVTDGFKGPNAANYDHYFDNFRVEEPNSMIGDKIYVGQFNVCGKVFNPEKSVEDNCTQFRFFTELNGWADASVMIGSNEADFYCVNITDKWLAGFTGDAVAGKGNWGIYNASATENDPAPEALPMTVVVDALQMKVYIKEGFHDVEFVGRDPEFK